MKITNKEFESRLKGFEIEYDLRQIVLTPLSGNNHFVLNRTSKRLEGFLIDEASFDPDATNLNWNGFLNSLKTALILGLHLIVSVPPGFGADEMFPLERDLRSKLDPFKKFIKEEEQNFYCPLDNFFVMGYARPKPRQPLQDFVDKYLSFLNWNLQKDLNGKIPNYRFDSQLFLDSLCDLSGKDLRLLDKPRFIAGHGAFNPFEDSFVNAVVQPNGSPFTYNSEMENLVRRLTKRHETPDEKSLKIFEWIVSNCEYGESKRDSHLNYRSALNVFNTREGVCGELALLQVALERLAGNKAFFAYVKTKNGWNHAVAYSEREPLGIFIDLTRGREGYNVSFPEFEIVSDGNVAFGYKNPQ